MTPTGMSETIGSEALKAVFMGAFDRLDRLPGLRTAFERVAALGVISLRDVCDPPPELVLDSLDTGTAGDVLGSHVDSCVVSAVEAKQWGTRALLSADRRAVFTIVEMMLGGDGTRPMPDAPRAFSRIEIGLVQRFFERLASALETAFAPVARSTFVVQSTADRIDFDVLGRQHSPVVAARFVLRAWQHVGEIQFVVPRPVIDSMREVLGQTASEETRKADPRWSSQIKDKITRTSVVLTSVLDERLAPLQEIASLQVGQILELSATAATRVRVECNGEPLLWCQLGKSNGVYTLRVEEPIDRDQEFMNDILAG